MMYGKAICCWKPFLLTKSLIVVHEPKSETDVMVQLLCKRELETLPYLSTSDSVYRYLFYYLMDDFTKGIKPGNVDVLLPVCGFIWS